MASAPPSILRRMLVSALLVIVGTYLSVCALVYFGQESLIYHPNKTLLYTPETLDLTYEDVWLTTEDGVKVNAWYIPAKNAKGTVFCCHGNAGNIGDRLDTFRMMHSLDLNIMMVDYRGYGASEGKPTEKGTYRDVDAAFNWLIKEKRLGAEDIFVYARSLGGGPGSYIAETYPVKALVMESVFSSIPDMGRHLYPWLPISWLSRYKYNNLARMANITCPVLVVHSPDDEIVPYHLGRKVYEAANEPKQFVEISGSHNDGYAVSHSTYYPAMKEFIQAHVWTK